MISQVVKVIISNETKRNYLPLHGMQQVEYSIASVTLLPKIYNLDLIIIKYKIERHTRIKYKIERHTRKSVILKCQGCESHGKTEELLQTEEDNTMTTKCNA